MSQINLLPPEFKIKEPVVRIGKILNKLSIIAFIVFLVSVGVSFGSDYFVDQRINDVIERQNNLKRSIQALSDTEHRFVLIQDRLIQAGKVLAKENTDEELQLVNEVRELMPEGMRLESAKLSIDKLDLEIESDNTTLLVGFIKKLRGKPYSEVVINSIEFASTRGYSISLSLVF